MCIDPNALLEEQDGETEKNRNTCNKNPIQNKQC